MKQSINQPVDGPHEEFFTGANSQPKVVSESMMAV